MDYSLHPPASTAHTTDRAISEERFWFQGAAEIWIAAYRWHRPGAAKGVVQLAHGLGEHALRYRHLLRKVIEAGYVVYANDHRGHGESARSYGAFGSFGEPGFDGLVTDMKRLTDIASLENPGLPVILLGHGLGSYAAQLYVVNYPTAVDALALCDSVALHVLKDLRTDVPAVKLNGHPRQSARAEHPPARDCNEANVDGADPLSGFGLDAASRMSVRCAAKKIGGPARLASLLAKRPLYIFSGNEDPMSLNGELLYGWLKIYQRNQRPRINGDVYVAARHELLDVSNREEAIADLLSWLNGIRPARVEHPLP